MPRGFSKQAEIEIEKRRKVVTANLLAGMNYRDMATNLGVAISTISNDVKIVIKRLHNAQVTDYAEILQIELRRIDTALNAIWGKILEGNLGAINTLMLLQNQRLKLLGFMSEFETSRSNLNLLTPEDLELIKQQRWNQVAGQLSRLVSDPPIITLTAEDA